MSKLTEPSQQDDGHMTNKKQSADVTVTAFEILQAVTGELPCHASPNWKRVRQEESHAKEDPCCYSPGSLGTAQGREGPSETSPGEEKN
jgi:hypothetical protein